MASKTQKILGVIAMVIVAVFGFFFSGFFGFFGDGSYFGIQTSCKKVKLPYLHLFATIEVFLVFIFVAFFIYQQSFEVFEKHKRNFIPLTYVFAGNVALMCIQVVQYPTVLRRYGFCTATGESVNTNLLFGIGTVHSILIALWYLALSRKVKLPQRANYIYLFLVILIGLQLAVIVFSKDKACLEMMNG